MAELTETTVERSRWTSKSSSKTKALKHDPPWQSQCEPLGIYEFLIVNMDISPNITQLQLPSSLHHHVWPVAIDPTFHRHWWQHWPRWYSTLISASSPPVSGSGRHQWHLKCLVRCFFVQGNSKGMPQKKHSEKDSRISFSLSSICMSQSSCDRRWVLCMKQGSFVGRIPFYHLTLPYIISHWHLDNITLVLKHKLCFIAPKSWWSPPNPSSNSCRAMVHSLIALIAAPKLTMLRWSSGIS